jgi:hypothetical protein
VTEWQRVAGWSRGQRGGGRQAAAAGTTEGTAGEGRDSTVVTVCECDCDTVLRAKQREANKQQLQAQLQQAQVRGVIGSVCYT